MQPTLALILCTIFVLFLLRLEHRQSPNASTALWFPTIWMMYIASKPLGTWLGMNGTTVESGSQLDQIFLVTLLCVGLLILFWRGFNWSRAIAGNIWLAILVGYMLLSILWSDIPFISFKRWTRELVAVVMAFLVVSERDPKQAMQSIFRRSTYILIPFSLLLIKYFPQLGREYSRWEGELMWVGATLQKNGLGRLCLVSAFFLIWTLVRRLQGRDPAVKWYQTPLEVFLLLLTLLLMKGPSGSYPATAIGSLVGGLVVYACLLSLKRHRMMLGAKTLAVIIVLVIGLGTVTPFVGGSTVGGFSSVFGRSETLTGRTDLWGQLVPDVERQPMLGSGFGGFWTTETMEANFGLSEAHNGYLAILLETGFAGLLLTAMFLVSCCIKAQKELYRDFDWAVLCICFIFMVVLHNISESSVFSFTRHLMAVLLFLSVLPSTSARSNPCPAEGARRRRC